MATPIPSNRARFSLSDVVSAVRGTSSHRGGRDEEIAESIVSDSRRVVPGGIFVALRGESLDGHAYAESAAARGARILIVGRASKLSIQKENCSVVEVDDTLVAWGDLARLHLERWRASVGGDAAKIVAITGSAGKTTTKELTAALLSEVAPTHFTAGNLNNRIGVPAVVFALEASSRFCVLEMGMSLPGELDAITAFARPDVSVVVNVGVAHAEGVGGREGVMREKGAVYRALGPDGIAIVNLDDPWVVRAAEGTRAARRFTFGSGASSEATHYRVVERAPERIGSRVRLACGSREISVHLPIPGEAAAIDLAAALAAQEAASGVRLPEDVIERALSRAGVTLSGRGNVRELRDGTLLLDDTYNANPASMRAALRTLAEIAPGRRRIAILGEMKELGPLAEEEHAALGDAIAEAKVAVAIGCGGLMSRALERAAALGTEVIASETTDEAEASALARVKPGDAVLVKGSRSVGTEKIAAALVRRAEEVR